ncbi:MAG: hypothetical protein DMD99_09915 [Candidatus Rokuibacteriota bacterium]|nr:MAG: hypothetical protein DMD99_09915 [Candidatus Rokubacteria bacterium]
MAPLSARSVTPTRAATPGSRSSPVQSRMVISVTISARWPASGRPASRGGRNNPAARPASGTASASVRRRVPPATAASVRLIARRHPPTRGVAESSEASALPRDETRLRASFRAFVARRAR